ncbi:MAG: hypothetical protein OXI73_03460 [Rhodospirillales bacterium]|nr:hypothetical protein [Rhodospirillales bacterium]MCY4098054.1 hypothetical protein [Rhodospirillales bacterium]MDE0371588.1 hypothetical protein [Rhodospirillales bacterium]MXX22743.1 hypothetical protein [Rhodospirillales bacterium]MYE19215.1 hypothetical protein [Rhodospirillales bacterium]
MKWAAPFFALIVSASVVQAAVEDCPQGPEGNLCKAENGDVHAMYMIGREAYDAARETGDYSEAYRWASRARAAGFLGGRMLFKMVHLQAGKGQHHDNVEAHQWITKAIAEGEDYLIPWKRRLERMMTPEQLKAALRAEAE